MSASSDALLAKTDAELQFFVANPEFYQPELVLAARRELKRRGINPAAPARPAASAATADYAADYLDEPAARRPWLVPLLVGLAVATGVVGYRWSVASERAAQAEAARTAARLTPAALKLETVATTEIPTYNIEQLVGKQLAAVPAAEKREAQPLRQFREMSRRFWTAETQSEYLTKLAHDGQAGEAFANQALLVRENWRAWNRGAVYGFRFGPTMRAQYELMGKVASSQQHILARLPNLLPNKEFLTDKELRARSGDVQAWMAELYPVSPVTGRKYEIPTLEAR